MKEEFLRPQGDATEIQPEDSKLASGKLSTPVEVEKHPSAPEIPGYILVSQIGQGAYAQVWKAWQTRTRKWVAIKVYIQTTGVNWLFLQREVERLIKLDKHPHIVSLLDADLNANPPYYVMDHMAGGALDQFVGSGKPASPGKAAEWMLEICRALAFVHSKGLIHCDLKPANILLDEEGHVRVADFGQSRIVTESSGALGTLFYMAPEQAALPKEGEPLQPDVGWDIYGLGATLWSVLAGQVPHSTDQTRKKIEAAQNLAERLRIYHDLALTEPLPDCSAAASAVDQDLEAIIGKCAQGRAADRYQTIGEVLDDLQSRVEKRPVSPLASNNVYRFKRFVQRNAVPLIITVAAAAALAFSITQTIRDRDSATRKLALSYILQAHNYAEKGDYPSAVTYYAESCRLVPSYLAKANALAYMIFLPRIMKHNGKLVIAAAFSPDGRTVITGSRREKEIIRWDASSGQRLSSFVTPYKNGVTSLAFSPDGKTILTGSDDGTARLWNALDGKPVGKVMQHKESVMAVAFSPDGRTILTGSVDKTVRQWDTNSGKPVGKVLPHKALVAAVAYSPDGKTILTGCDDNTARLWDARSGEQFGKVMKHNAWVLAVAFSPDGKTLLTGSEDKGVRLWDARSGEPIGRVMYHDGIVDDVTFSPDGRTILSAGDKTARLWSSATREPIAKLIGHTSWVNAVAYSPDGNVILTGSSDKTARLWDTRRGKPLVAKLKNNSETLAIAFSPDFRTLAAAGLNNSVRLWDIQSGEAINKAVKHSRRIRAVAFSPDGRTILTGSDDRTARLWNAHNGEPIGKIMKHKAEVLRFAFSADAKTILTVSWNRTVSLWNAHSGEPAGKSLENSSGVNTAAFSPDGKTIITGDFENTAKLWDARSGLQLGKVMRLNDIVGKVAYSNDGKTVFTGTAGDSTFRLWNANNGAPISKLMNLNGKVNAIAFSPDDRTILTGGAGNTAQLWDALSGEPIGSVLRHDGSVLAVGFSSDGKTVYTASADNTVRSLDTSWLSEAKDISPAKLVSIARAATGYRVNENGDMELIPESK